MAPLQVITVDLLPCLTHLLNDHELGLVLDNALGRRIFVSRDQHKR